MTNASQGRGKRWSDLLHLPTLFVLLAVGLVRALNNNMYIVAPNIRTYYLFPGETTPIDTFGGRFFIFDYKGRIVGRQEYGAGSIYVGCAS